MLLHEFSVAAAKDFNFKTNILYSMLNSGRTGYSCQCVTNCSLNEFNASLNTNLPGIQNWGNSTFFKRNCTRNYYHMSLGNKPSPSHTFQQMLIASGDELLISLEITPVNDIYDSLKTVYFICNDGKEKE